MKVTSKPSPIEIPKVKKERKPKAKKENSQPKSEPKVEKQKQKEKVSSEPKKRMLSVEHLEKLKLGREKYLEAKRKIKEPAVLNE